MSTFDLLPNLWPGNCFACSPHNPHGLRLTFERIARGARSRCTLPAHLCGYEGIAHGGVVATLLDEAAAWALIAHAGRLGFTESMKITFHRSTAVGVPLVVEGRVENVDGRAALTRAEVRSEEGALLAEATGEWTLMSLGAAARMFKLDRSRLEQFVAAVHRPGGEGPVAQLDLR